MSTSLCWIYSSDSICTLHCHCCVCKNCLLFFCISLNVIYFFCYSFVCFMCMHKWYHYSCYSLWSYFPLYKPILFPSTNLFTLPRFVPCVRKNLYSKFLMKNHHDIEGFHAVLSKNTSSYSCHYHWFELYLISCN